MDLELLVIGWVSLDSLLIKGKHHLSPGGAALYSSLSSANCVKTVLLSKIGNDFPKRFIDRFKSKGIKISESIRTNGLSTKFKVSYDGNWQAQYEAIEQGVGTEMNIVDIPLEYQTISNILVTPMHPDIQKKWIEKLIHRNCFIGLGTNAIYTKDSTLKKNIIDNIQHCKLFACNFEESRDIFGSTDPLENLVRMGKLVENGIITMDKSGAIGIRKGKITTIRAQTVEIIDPSGAGDVFLGAFTGSFLLSRDFSKAMVFASETATRSIQHTGISTFIEIN